MAPEIQAHADRDLLKSMVRTVLQRVVEEEVKNRVGASRQGRSTERVPRASNYGPRTKIRVGEIEVEVPQVAGEEPALAAKCTGTARRR